MTELSRTHGILFTLWRALTLPAIILLVLAAYGGMRWIAVDRLNRPDYAARMRVAAVATAYSEDHGPFDRGLLETRLEDALRRAENAGAGGFAQGDDNGHDRLFQAAVRLSRVDDRSPEMPSALAQLNTALAGYGPPESKPEGWFRNRMRDQYRFDGASLGSRTSGLEDLREGARTFLRHADAYDSGLARTDPVQRWRRQALPLQYWIAPWELFRFFDPKRADLCNQIPFGFASILLATSFLLRFRLTDFDPATDSNASRVMPWSPPKPKDLVPADARIWIQVDQHPYDHLRGLPVRGLRAWWCVVPFMPAAEIGLNPARTWLETLVNIPIVLIAALAATTAIPLVIQFTRAMLNSGLAGHSVEYLDARIRPGITGLMALGIAALWMGVHSVLRLAPSTKHVIVLRGVVQALLAVVILVMVMIAVKRLSTQLERLLDAAPDPRKQGTAPRSHLSRSTRFGLPMIDRDAMLALVAALVPAPMIVGQLL